MAVLRSLGHATGTAVLPDRRAGDRDRLLRPGSFGAVLGRSARVPGRGRATSGPSRDLIPDSGIGVEVLLQQVPEGKREKNRVHLDLRTADPETEVRRVLDLGASMVTDHPVTEHGWRWQILADPDGNEFCVLQPAG
jgi:hypothetical protein